MDLITTGLGAGSYPEPPIDNSPDPPECERCGETENLTDVHESILCPACRAEYVFENSTQEEYLSYIKDNYKNQKDFYIHWFLENLDDMELLTEAKTIFAKQDKDIRDYHIKSFVKDSMCEFVEFLDCRRD